MNDEEMVPMVPWWRGFKGEIKLSAKHKYDVTGVVRKINDTTVEITELPVHVWTAKYKSELETMLGNEKGEGALIKVYCHSVYEDVINSNRPISGLQRASRQRECAFCYHDGCKRAREG